MICIDELPLIERQIRLLSRYFNRITISGKSEFPLSQSFPDCEISFIMDKYPGCGPIGGIHSALSHAQSGAVFVFACDMPDLNENLIIRQILQFENTHPDILVPQHNNGLEPLHAIYSKNCLPVMHNQIKNMSFKIQNIFPQVKTIFMNIDKKLTDCFFNINTKKDFLLYLLSKEKVR